MTTQKVADNGCNCTSGWLRYLRPRDKYDGYGQGPCVVQGYAKALPAGTRAIYIPCGRCAVCIDRAGRRRAAKVIDWLRAVLSSYWGRGICVLVTCTLDPENGSRSGAAGRSRIQQGLTRVKAELRRQLPAAARILFTCRSYELHRDEHALHAHVIFFIGGCTWRPDIWKLGGTYGEGRFEMSVRPMESSGPEFEEYRATYQRGQVTVKHSRLKGQCSIESGVRYVAKYVLKPRTAGTFLPGYKGTRWWSVWSSRHRVVPRVPKFAVIAWKGRTLWKPEQLRFKLSSRSLPGQLVAELLTSSRGSLTLHSEGVGWLMSSPLPHPSSSVCLR